MSMQFGVLSMFRPRHIHVVLMCRCRVDVVSMTYRFRVEAELANVKTRYL